MINPFYLRYKKPEDRVTILLVHVLDQCGLIAEFLNKVAWNGSVNNSFENNPQYGLQMHENFMKEVKIGYIVGISNTGQIKGNDDYDEHEDQDQQEHTGHPDAYFYDQTKKMLIILETKVGNGQLSQKQLDNHIKKVNNTTLKRNDWIQGTIDWKTIEEMLDIYLKGQHSDLKKYIAGNFRGVLLDEVLQTKEYDDEYFMLLAGKYQPVIRKILSELENYKDYYTIEPKGSHNEIRYKIGTNRRFVTFVLSDESSRFILSPGGKIGVEWRDIIHKNYGIIHSHQDIKKNYIDELSIPLSCISESDLRLMPLKSDFIVGNFMDVRVLIQKTFDYKAPKKIKRFFEKKQES